MEEYYRMFFKKIYEDNPLGYQDEIHKYIDQLKKIAKTHPTIMYVAIFSVFRIERDSLYPLFSKIYDQYDLSSHMNEADKQYIANSFIEKIQEIGKEFI